MPTVSVNIPEEMQKRMKELSEEGMYQNISEYIRDALREKIESDKGLTPEEEDLVLERLKNDQREGKKLDEIKQELGLD